MSENKAENAENVPTASPPSSQELAEGIYRRVREKKQSYTLYNLERSQEEAFATFFDLAQEFTTIGSIYQLCVAVPKEFFGLDCILYIINPKRSRLEKVCTSAGGLTSLAERDDHEVILVDESVQSGGCWFFPIRGNRALSNSLPFLGQGLVLGMFQIFSGQEIDERKRFFLEKFTNRIGYNLHQKLLVQQNIDHLKFINQLVSDIEHNVISPNMYYKLFLIRLKKMIATYDGTEKLLEKISLEFRSTCRKLRLR